MASSLEAPDRYELRERLGAGSIGVVFRALDRETGQEVALKSLQRFDPDDLYLLKHEFRVLAGITHPNLVRLFDLEIGDKHAFLTMELVLGRDLIEYVGNRGEPAGDYERLRDAFSQLTLGLDALHRSGKLHRDVKPQNVLVEDGGRVVLVDFGLVVGTRSALSLASQREGFAGTLLYTSPEQAWGQPISPAADWYSAGVVLYECLTGRLPFDGPGLGALLDRKHRAPPSPRALAPTVPGALADLALDLLHYEPERRPRAEEILERLRSGSAPWAPPAAPRRAAGSFVGRSSELARLRAAFAETRRREGSALCIEGPSGIGKTTLVEHFLGELQERGDVVVLRSRCHPHESVRFEAIDGLVDELSRFLIHETPERLDALRPRQLRPLVRVFPVLGRVPFAAYEREPDWSDADPQEIRRRGFAALRELLGRIADRQPLVLWVDDLQWGDLDSAPFLRGLLRPPDAPPLLLLLSYRSEDRDRSELLLSLATDEEGAGLAKAERMPVPPLAPEEAERLVAELFHGADPTLRRSLVREAQGSPFFVGELARSLEEKPAAASREPGAIGLDEVIATRLRRLPSGTRELLELVAVFGGPIEAKLLLGLPGQSGGGRPQIYDLCNSSLLRVTAGGERLETYHGRIRDVLLDRLAPADRSRRHRQLADGLGARADADPAAVLTHYLGAGDEQAAGPYALEAAERADRALVFDRAAELYELAFRLRGAADADWSLLERSAQALANAGRSSRAAAAYAVAAEAATRAGEPAHVLASQRGHAVEQHLYCGERAQGLALLPRVLADIGLSLPATPAAAARRALWLRARFLLRGTRFRVRPPASLGAAERVRLEVLRGAARGTSMLDHALSDALAVRHLLDALAAGEPSHILRALALEAGIEANVGGEWLRRRSQRLMRRVEELVELTGDPFDRAWLQFSHSAVAFFCGAWRECVERGERAVEILRAECLGVAWELAVNHLFTLSALAQQGRLRELEARLPLLLDDARSRGDRYALVAARTADGAILPLAQDDPERARRELDAALEPYAASPFSSLHYQHLHGTVQTELYEGDGRGALARIERAWPELGRAGFLRLDCVGTGLRYLLVRAALAAARESPDRARLARLAANHARRIARSSLPHTAGQAAAIRAGVASLRGDAEACATALADAVERFERADARLWTEAARFALGRLRGGDDGRALLDAAESWMASEGVASPERLAQMLVPVSL